MGKGNCLLHNKSLFKNLSILLVIAKIKIVLIIIPNYVTKDSKTYLNVIDINKNPGF